MLISDAVHIWREPDGDYHIEWQVTDPGTEVTVDSEELLIMSEEDVLAVVKK